MVRSALVALVLTLALGAFASPPTPSASLSELACGDEESAPPEDSEALYEDSEALQRFACGDEEKAEGPEDSSLQLS